MRYGIGALAKSLAGHDKNQIFIIIEEHGEYVSLMDGTLRSREKPKCKNKKHIQVIHDDDESQRRELIEGKQLTDEAARSFIRRYASRQRKTDRDFGAGENQS